MSSRSRLVKTRKTISPYIKHLPLLVLAGVSCIWIVKIITTKNPQDVANFPIQQLYLELLVAFFLFMNFLFGYLTLNMRRGSVVALFTTVLLLFRLQQIEFELWWLIPSLLLFLVTIFLTKKPSPQPQLETQE